MPPSVKVGSLGVFWVSRIFYIHYSTECFLSFVEAAAKLDILSSIPGIHMMEGEKGDSSDFHMHTQSYTHKTTLTNQPTNRPTNQPVNQCNILKSFLVGGESNLYGNSGIFRQYWMLGKRATLDSFNMTWLPAPQWVLELIVCHWVKKIHIIVNLSTKKKYNPH